MHVLFALIFVVMPFGDAAYNQAPVRVGAYEKLSQCKAQGRGLVDAMKAHEVRGAYFYCVPVNK